MKPYDTWALPLLKQKLLNAERVTQEVMLKETDGKAWRLSAAIYYLKRSGWDISTVTHMDRTVEYHLDHSEIQRIKAGKKSAVDIEVQIKDCRRTLQQEHPDKGGDPERFKAAKTELKVLKKRLRKQKRAA